MTTKSKIKPADLAAEMQEQRLRIIEEEMDKMNNDIQVLLKMVDSLSYNLRETQQFAIKIGVSQSRVQDRVMRWPFVKIVGEDSKE